MNQRSTQLDGLQRWILSVITNVEAAEPNDVDEIVLPSNQQSASERLAVYQHAYLARLLDVLRELFPCTRYAVGDELFDRFTRGYVQKHPPRSYTLARLADKLAEHLDATRPADWGGFIVDLVRLEHAIDRVFDAAGPENTPPLTIPAEAAVSMKLMLVPGFELHAYAFPVSAFYTQWKAGAQPRWPDPEPQFVALTRRDYIVRRYELTAVQYDMLLALSRGDALGEAIAATAERSDSPVEHLAAEFRAWFAFWTQERFFERLD